MKIDKDVLKVLNESDLILDQVDSYIQSEVDLKKKKKAEVIHALLLMLKKAGWNLGAWNFDTDDVTIYSDRHEAGRWTMLNKSKEESMASFIAEILSNTIDMPYYYDTGSSEPWYLIKDDYDVLCKIAKECEAKFNIPVKVCTGLKAWISFAIDNPDAWNDEAYTDLTVADFENGFKITNATMKSVLSILDENEIDYQDSDISDLKEMAEEIIDECGID